MPFRIALLCQWATFCALASHTGYFFICIFLWTTCYKNDVIAFEAITLALHRCQSFSCPDLIVIILSLASSLDLSRGPRRVTTGALITSPDMPLVPVCQTQQPEPKRLRKTPNASDGTALARALHELEGPPERPLHGKSF